MIASSRSGQPKQRGPFGVIADKAGMAEVVVPIVPNTEPQKGRPRSPLTWPILPTPQIVFPDFSETIEKPFDMIGAFLGDAPKQVLSDRGPPVLRRQKSDGSNASQKSMGAKVYKANDTPVAVAVAAAVIPARETNQEMQVQPNQNTLPETPYPFEGEILPLETFQSKTSLPEGCVGLTWPSPAALLYSCGPAEARDEFESVEMSALDDATVGDMERPPEHILLNNEDPLMQQQLLMQQQILLKQLKKKQLQHNVSQQSALARIGSSIRGGLGRQRKAKKGQAKEVTVEQLVNMGGNAADRSSNSSSRAKKRDVQVPGAIPNEVGDPARPGRKHNELKSQTPIASRGHMKAKAKQKKKRQESQTKKTAKDVMEIKRDGERPKPPQDQSKSMFLKFRSGKQREQSKNEAESVPKTTKGKKSTTKVPSRPRSSHVRKDAGATRGRLRSRIIVQETEHDPRPKARSRSLEAKPYDMASSPRAMDRRSFQTFSGQQRAYPIGTMDRQAQHYWENPRLHRQTFSHPTQTMEAVIKRPLSPYYPSHSPTQVYSINEYEKYPVRSGDTPMGSFLPPPPQYYTPRPYHTFGETRDQPEALQGRLLATPMSGEEVEVSGHKRSNRAALCNNDQQLAEIPKFASKGDRSTPGATHRPSQRSQSSWQPHLAHSRKTEFFAHLNE
jgi:hypothetical protein